VFTIDSRCHNVDMIFTDNETNSVRRHHVLYKRQLKSEKKCCQSDRGDQPVPTSCHCETADVSFSAQDNAAPASTAVVTDTPAAFATPSADELSNDDHTDTDNESDEETDSLSGSHVGYTKDAFHRYIINGQLLILSQHFFFQRIDG